MNGMAGEASYQKAMEAKLLLCFHLYDSLDTSRDLLLPSTDLSCRLSFRPYLIRVLQHEKNAVIPNLPDPQPAKSQNWMLIRSYQTANNSVSYARKLPTVHVVR